MTGNEKTRQGFALLHELVGLVNNQTHDYLSALAMAELDLDVSLHIEESELDRWADDRAELEWTV